LIAAVGLALTGPFALAGETARNYDPRAAFAEADLNHDGSVDHEEFQVRIVEIFYSADRNKDGFLDAEELKQLTFPDDFTADDKDEDGRVSLREFLRVRFREYDAADGDHDGVLSLEEVIVAYEGKKR
jgi:Ca2+-binding EF-hand superfamily protein